MQASKRPTVAAPSVHRDVDGITFTASLPAHTVLIHRCDCLSTPQLTRTFVTSLLSDTWLAAAALFEALSHKDRLLLLRLLE
jgi:hypothetical protein